MQQKILILDKDGTLVKPLSGQVFPKNPQDQLPLAGSEGALILAQQYGYKIAVASNQLGIQYGYKNARFTIEEFLFLHTLFPQLDFSVFCPDEGETLTEVNYQQNKVFNKDRKNWSKSISQHLNLFRKPDSGMIEFILARYNYQADRDKCLYIGDRPEDEQAAMKVGVYFIWADIFNQGFKEFLL